MKKLRLFVLIAVAWVHWHSNSIAQNKVSSENKKTEEKEQKFSFGNISPVILAQNRMEATALSDLTSYWVLNKYGNNLLDRYRISRSENYINASYGFSKNRRWDLGAQLRYSRLRIDETARNSPFKVFAGTDSSGTSYTGLSGVGLRLRTQPFESIPELTIQGSVNFPLIKNIETKSFLSADRIQTDLVTTFYKSIDDSWYLYLQGRYILQLANKDNNKTSHFPGISAYMVKSMFDHKAFLFPGISYIGSYQQNYKGGRLIRQAQFIMVSIGLQVQPSNQFSIFINGQRPFYHKSSASFYSDLVRNSYSDWAIGVRFVL